MGYDDSNKLFKAGEGAMTITGSWLAGELINDTDQKFGFFLLPGNPGQTRLAIGGVGIPFAIRKTTHPCRPGCGIPRLDGQPALPSCGRKPV